MSVDRTSLRGRAQTVLGPVAPEALGPALMHEHLIVDIRPPLKRTPADLGPPLRLDTVWAINYGTATSSSTSCP
jgi:phosphotriesterase-related protein